MLRNKFVGALVLGGAMIASPAFSQESPKYRSEATVQALGSFQKDTTEGAVEHSATNSGGVLANYRVLLTERHGLEVNYGYQRSSLSYNSPSGSRGLTANSHEVSGAYVYRFPLIKDLVRPFALGGGGLLVFDRNSSTTTNTQTRAAAIYGGGADIGITNRLFLRAQYRGLIYNSPNFKVAGFSADRITHRAEPSAGIGFRF